MKIESRDSYTSLGFKAQTNDRQVVYLEVWRPQKEPNKHTAEEDNYENSYSFSRKIRKRPNIGLVPNSRQPRMPKSLRDILPCRVERVLPCCSLVVGANIALNAESLG